VPPAARTAERRKKSEGEGEASKSTLNGSTEKRIRWKGMTKRSHLSMCVRSDLNVDRENF
jgi:hypothetical protein